MASDLITAPWHVSLQGVVVLDWPDCVDAEPMLQRRSLVQAAQPIRAANEVLFDRGNIGWTLSYTRVSVCTSAPLAQQLATTWALALPSGTGDCVMTLGYEAGTQTLSGALIAAGGFKTWAEANQAFAQYEIIGSALTTAFSTPET